MTEITRNKYSGWHILEKFHDFLLHEWIDKNTPRALWEDGDETVDMTQSWEGLMETSECPYLSFSEGGVNVMMSTLPGHCIPRQSKIFRDLWVSMSKGMQCIVLPPVTTVSDGQDGILRGHCMSSWPQNSPGIWSPHSHATASARWHQPSLLPGPCYIL